MHSSYVPKITQKIRFLVKLWPKTKIKLEKCKNNEKGTEINFIPDESIFETTQFHYFQN